MANIKLTGLTNGNLAFELEKIKCYDKPKVKKQEFQNDVHGIVFTIEVNDSSYFYGSKKERDKDLATLKKHLVGKPVIHVNTKQFVEFMTDDNGTEMDEVAKILIKKGSYTVEDMLSNCGYIPSSIIKNKNKVPKEFRDAEIDGDFEVNPENCIVFLT